MPKKESNKNTKKNNTSKGAKKSTNKKATSAPKKKTQEVKPEAPQAPTQSRDNPYLIPLSIVVAGAFIAVAVYFSGMSGNSVNTAQNTGNNDVAGDQQKQQEQEITFREISDRDHIKGDKDAPVKIIEYSDTECPFCKRIHGTLQQIVDDYDGEVAWVYRHAPLAQLHQKAEREAQATECAYELGGHDGFWAYLDRLMEITPSNDGLADSQLPEIASYAGLNRAAFQSCLDSGKYADYVQTDLDDAMRAGLRGTPYSVVVAPNGKTYPVSGAQPYSSIKATVDLALQQK